MGRKTTKWVMEKDFAYPVIYIRPRRGLGTLSRIFRNEMGGGHTLLGIHSVVSLWRVDGPGPKTSKKGQDRKGKINPNCP